MKSSKEILQFAIREFGGISFQKSICHPAQIFFEFLSSLAAPRYFHLPKKVFSKRKICSSSFFRSRKQTSGLRRFLFFPPRKIGLSFPPSCNFYFLWFPNPFNFFFSLSHEKTPTKQEMRKEERKNEGDPNFDLWVLPDRRTRSPMRTHSLVFAKNKQGKKGDWTKKRRFLDTQIFGRKTKVVERKCIKKFSN